MEHSPFNTPPALILTRTLDNSLRHGGFNTTRLIQNIPRLENSNKLLQPTRPCQDGQPLTHMFSDHHSHPQVNTLEILKLRKTGRAWHESHAFPADRSRLPALQKLTQYLALSDIFYEEHRLD